MKIYISGPINGIPDARARFALAKCYLDEIGHEPITPFDNDGVHATTDAEYAQSLREDLLVELQCEAVFMLIGWENSAGARVEFLVAQACGLKIFYQMREGMIL